MSTIKNIVKSALALSALALIAFGLPRIASVSAQSSSLAPSGMFTCLINANYSGYLAKLYDPSEHETVNALLVINFSSAAPLTGSLVASVINNVTGFEGLNPATATTTSLPDPVTFTLTQVTDAQNVFSLQSNTPGDVLYYIAVVNGGDSLLLMSAPTADKVHNGACQKV